MIDIGVNLLNGQFVGDLEDVLARARQAPIAFMLVTSTDLEDTAAAIDLAERHDDLRTHPPCPLTIKKMTLAAAIRGAWTG